MAEKKYQVFISSTYADLKEERRKILDILLMADCIPAGMEAFVASDAEQFEVIKKVIDLCDYYILIIGKRYGSINEQTGLSYTEMEYDYAKEQGIPVLVFALDESVEVPPEKVEDAQEKVEALQKFRQKALENTLATIWKTQSDLTGAVAVSILKATKEIPRPGWQRAAEYDEASLRRDIMALQKEKNDLSTKLDAAQQKIMQLTTVSDVAYEGYAVEIKYKHQFANYAPSYGTKKRTLPELFRIISTEMIGVSISEKAIEIALLRAIFPKDTHEYTFSDPQFVKVILNQLKALNLLQSKWISEKSDLYWSVTTKGVVERNKMILVRNSQEEA